MTPFPRRHRRAALAAITSLTLLGGAPAVAAGPVAAAAPGDLLISEYIEGSSNNKAIEIYNGTGAAVNLGTGDYSVKIFFNGATTSTTFTLTGTVADGDVFVLASSAASATILAQADQTTGAGLFNGDDAIVLLKGTTVIDSLGQVGVDPGVEWGTGLVSTQDNTLRRQADVCAGDPLTNDVFDPAAEWDGFATDTFDGLGSHVVDCGTVEPASAVINEFSANTTGTDVEYIEILGSPSTDYSNLTVLEIEGDVGSPPNTVGTVDGEFVVGTTGSDGRALISLSANALENGTMSLLLVRDWDIAIEDIDADNDGVVDVGLDVVDAIAVSDGGAGDAAFGGVVLTASYDGLAQTPGGASRIPDGVDTDTVDDWMRNDFDLAGIEGFAGTPVIGEALNTPGAVNVAFEPPPGGVCGDPVTAIAAVQGSGAVTPLAGQMVSIEGVVVGDFQTSTSFRGFFVQDAGDGDPETSDGIYIPAATPDVAVGDRVRVTGTANESFTQTVVSGDVVLTCSSGNPIPAPVALTLPVADYEDFESMHVTLVQELAILEYFNYGRFGEIAIGLGDATFRQYTPTAVYPPESAERADLQAYNLSHRILLDDGLNIQNPDFLRHPNGMQFTLDNRFRGGDTVSNVTGVLDYRFSFWRIQPTEPADYVATNPRPEVPEVGGTLTVGSFNVLNYFTTLTRDDANARGADTPEEFARQQVKIVAAINQMDTDIVGLIEIENNGGVAVDNLVAALNSDAGETRWAAVDTGVIGTDVITTAFIYQPATVTPVGSHAILDSTVDPRFLDDFNRPALAQTFQEHLTGELVTVTVNHLKSKGSGCDAVGDPEDLNGQGNCNGVRTDAAEALADWLAADPTGTGAENTLIIGDLNSYDKEDPIQVLVAAGYHDLLLQFQGEFAYSYVFDGMLGYLDYALANPSLADNITGASAWNINADEPSVLDYDMSFKGPGQDALFAPDPYRSSDHDPVIIGLQLDNTAPVLTVAATPTHIWPPNGKWRTVTTDIVVSDDSDDDVTVELVSAEASGGGQIVVVSDTEFRVRAVLGATYTLTYRATDDSGNSTEVTTVVRVEKPDKPGKPGKDG